MTREPELSLLSDRAKEKGKGRNTEFLINMRNTNLAVRLTEH